METDIQTISRWVNHTSRAQLIHRMALVEFWAPQLGDRILEVGCGHGDTTVALAEAVGESGQVTAIDKAGPSRGGSTTLSEAHSYIESSDAGLRIEFRLSTDFLGSGLEFAPRGVDLIVFSHRSWYMRSVDELEQSFARARQWGNRLGYAEWDLRPSDLKQLPHLLSALLQIQIRTISEAGPGNIYSLVSPHQAGAAAERAGWQLERDRVIGTSADMEDGRTWEIHWAIHMAKELTEGSESGVAAYHREIVDAEAKLLSDVSDAQQNMSLDSFMFTAR